MKYRSKIAIYALLILFLAGCTQQQWKEGDDQKLTLAAGDLNLVLDMSNNGGVVSLGTGDMDIVSMDWKTPTLFAIGLVEDKRQKVMTSLDFEEFRYRETARGVQLHYRNHGENSFGILLTLESGDEHISMQAEVECGSQTLSSGLYFPYVCGYESLSGNPEDDHYLSTHMSGEVYPDPARTLRGLNRGMLDTDGYPGTQGMQFSALYNPKGGVMMYTPDPESYPKRFDLMKHKGGEDIAWILLHYFDETPGFRFDKPYEIRLAAMGDSWYDAADIYAEWGREQSWTEKKISRPEWLDKMPIAAYPHDNENWQRCPPAWYALHQPEMNKILGPREMIVSFFRWEHYGSWISPESFPPLGGEEAMLDAASRTRAWGGHLKHLFSCSRYWLHEDVTDIYFEKVIRRMAAIQRLETTREDMTREHAPLGEFVNTCPGSEDFRQTMIDYADKISGDYQHDFISMDIWPASQPVPCHNPEHEHPPGLGLWYVKDNIKMVEGMQEAVFDNQPDALFGGEGMAEPYMPYFHSYLMRSASAPLEMHQGNISKIRVPMFDYVYGDLFTSWEGYSTTTTITCRAETALQFVRGKMLHLTDKWHPRYFNIQETISKGKVVLLEDVILGDESDRIKDLEFAARMHDFQNGEFNEYFTRGRTGRLPECYAMDPANGNWRAMTVYDLRPAIGVIQLDGKGKLIWLFGNGWETKTKVRLKADNEEMQKSTMAHPPEFVEFDGETFIEVNLDPLEIGVIEWISAPK